MIIRSLFLFSLFLTLFNIVKRYNKGQEKKIKFTLRFFMEKNVKAGELYDNFTGYHLSQHGLTYPLKKEQYSNLRRLFRPTLLFFLGSICNLTITVYIYSDTFSSTCNRQKGAAPRGFLNRGSFNNYQSDNFSPRRPSIESQVTS